MLISACVVVMGLGLCCFFNKELVWSLYEHDARMLGKIIRRAPGWETLLNVQGAVFILGGLFGIFVALR
jgi:hypothetical protein